MPRTDKLSTYRTTFETQGERGSVTYVSTRIVEWNGQTVTLNSGGWQTVTTKRKMNQASQQFGLGYMVSQRKGNWFVYVKTGHNKFDELPFVDGMSFSRGTVRFETCVA